MDIKELVDKIPYEGKWDHIEGRAMVFSTSISKYLNNGNFIYFCTCTI